MKFSFQKYLFIICCLLSISQSVSGQFYGLSFVGSEDFPDERTGLDLSRDHTICLENSFSLSFDISFQPDQLEYFGYIFRIIDSKNRNIDLISNLQSPTNSHLIFINEGNSTPHSFELENTGIFYHWNRFTFDFDYAKQEVRYSFLGMKNVQPMSFEPNSCFKILFGANDFPKFKTTDVPPMNIRNIEIQEGGAPRNKWPLNEHSGNTAKDNISGQEGYVRHPLWIKKMRMDWKHLGSITAEGPISVAFDAEDELIHFVGLDSLLSFSCANNQLTQKPYLSGRLHLLRGNQSYFDQHQKKLHNIYLDQETIVTYDQETQTWNKNFEPPERITDNWQYNKFYSPADSAIYLIGGYGHFTYKNKVRKYHLPTQSWDSIIPPAESFVPRYLAALGAVDNGAYILGGYGTHSGQQIHNPTNLYDLVFFDVKKNTFEKIYDLKVQEEFVLANSLVVDEKTRSYYGLIFSKHQFNSNLQLIKGSLDTAAYTEVGNKIPFKFYDINSFVDLFYAPKLDRFFAVTLFHNTDNVTEAAIYSLAAPPLPVQAGENASAGYPSSNLILLIVGILLMVGLVYYFKRRPKAGEISHVPLNTPLNQHEPVLEQPSEQAQRNMVYLFGVFQLFDHEGNDNTKHFTPLIRELFLVILLYTIRWERGISSEKLKELLWHDKSTESARNNRSVNIAKLKVIISKVDGCQISKETGYWKVNMDPSKMTVDYLHYRNIVQNKGVLNKKNIQELIGIVQRGSFLSNLEYEWLDSFKAEISNEVIDIYIHFINSIDIAEDPEFMIEIANCIFYFDLVNEEAMMLKCKALVFLGKHSLAKGVFENFRREYKIIYGEEFCRNFNAVLE